MRHLLNLGIYSILVLVGLSPSASAASMQVGSLRCEFRENPIGIDTARPRLGWLLENPDPAARGLRQTAYQILAASSAERLAKDQGDLWDSTKIKSGETRAIAYAGVPLNSTRQVFWKVRVWDQDDAPSAWSAAGEWTMGLVKPQDWKTTWITAANFTGTGSSQSLLLRRDFTVSSGLRRAIVHVSGVGHYEMSINGAKVGNDLLTPGWTNYEKTVIYDSYDITPLLRDGSNAAGLMLGNGMYHVEKTRGRYTKFSNAASQPKAIALLRLDYADGHTETIATDSLWTTHAGPITFSNTYGGEDYDARLEHHGWNQPGYDAKSWSSAVTVDGPKGALKGLSVTNPPIRTFEVFKPVAKRELRPGVAVYDMGQNASLMPRLTVRGPAGSIVRIIPSELLKDDGTANQKSGGGPSYWQYTLAGTGSETYFPKFFYRGSRYQQVELIAAPGSSELPVVESLECVMLHAASPVVGSFSSSNELFNRTWSLIRWAQRSNMFSVMTDCPHREKLGWLEEDHLNGPALRYNFDMGVMFAKSMNDMADAQLDNGFVPNIAPEYVKFGGDGDSNPFRNSPEWGSAFLLVAWQQYQFNGDLELLRRHYDGMVRYVNYLASKADSQIIDIGLGDWYDIGPKHPGPAQLTPKALTATAIYYEDITVLAKTARLLGKAEDAKRFDALAADIRAAFNRKFFNSSTHSYSTNSQTANAMPYVLGLVDPADAPLVLDAIVKDVREKGLTAGDVGYRYLLRALADGGRSDVIFEMNNQSEKPGYGMQLQRGATSLTEAWDANPGPSQNHFMLGQINEWFFHDLAGIQPDPAAPGFQRSVIRPAAVGDLKWVKASYDSVCGKITSEWQKDGNRFTLKLTIPANTTSTVYLPTLDPKTILEHGKPINNTSGIQFLRMEASAAVFTIGSGTYVFESRLF